MRLLLACAAVAAALVAAGTRLHLERQPAFASFHLAEISEVMAGFDGDAGVQYVEINQRNIGQNFIAGTKLVAFGPTGAYLGTVLTIPSMPNPPIPNSGNGVRWIMGTAAFEAAAGMQADFEFAPGVIPAAAGMVCWGASSGESNPNNHVDCVAYGGYSGPLPPQVPAPGPSAHPPGDCQRSLTRTVPAMFDASIPPTDTWADGNSATDFALAAPTPRNNAGIDGALVGLDTDGDGTFDCRDGDDDDDGLSDAVDNCRLVANPGQADADADFAGDACDPFPGDQDGDDDGCFDGKEMGTDHTLGGERNPADPWDFYDVTGDAAIDLGDALEILAHFGHAPAGDPFDQLADRTAIDGTKPWQTSEQDDGIDFTDALLNLASFGDGCA